MSSIDNNSDLVLTGLSIKMKGPHTKDYLISNAIEYIIQNSKNLKSLAFDCKIPTDSSLVIFKDIM